MNFVQDFMEQNPTHILVQINLANSYAGVYLTKIFNICSSCWEPQQCNPVLEGKYDRKGNESNNEKLLLKLRLEKIIENQKGMVTYVKCLQKRSVSWCRKVTCHHPIMVIFQNHFLTLECPKCEACQSGDSFNWGKFSLYTTYVRSMLC